MKMEIFHICKHLARLFDEKRLNTCIYVVFVVILRWILEWHVYSFGLQ